MSSVVSLMCLRARLPPVREAPRTRSGGDSDEALHTGSAGRAGDYRCTMQLTPRYNDPSFLRIDLPLGDPAAALIRQRRRFAGGLADLDDEQWATSSRCEGWSVQDVVAHLVDTNQFWTLSIGAAVRGEPSRFLTAFDPVATPAALVDAARSRSSGEVLEQFVTTTEALAQTVTNLDEASWALLGEAPLGHVPIRAIVLHALWDSWVHERDVLLPLGLAPVEEPDEIIDSLGYVATLSPAFAVAGGSTRSGSVHVETTDLDCRFVVEVGETVVLGSDEPLPGSLRLTGTAVDLLEALSFRAPLPCPVDDEHRWLLAGLAEVFDRAD